MQTALPSNRLAELIRDRGISEAHIAVECGVHQSTVSRWRSGASQIPDEQKFRIARYLGVTVARLMGWDQDPALKDAA